VLLNSSSAVGHATVANRIYLYENTSSQVD